LHTRGFRGPRILPFTLGDRKLNCQNVLHDNLSFQPNKKEDICNDYINFFYEKPCRYLVENHNFVRCCCFYLHIKRNKSIFIEDGIIYSSEIFVFSAKFNSTRPSKL
jgi:hypothetical protein